jgi:hypothetical protein
VRWGLVGAVLSTVVALAGCTLLPGAAGPVARDADESFELVLRVGSARYGANQPIDASATLSYLGPEAGIDLVGSGSGLIGFTARQLDGRLAITGGHTADCQTYRLDRGRPMEVPYAKSGGWSNDDPDAAFYKAFFADPVFRLPRGRWLISASAGFTVGECGGPSRALGSEVTIVVE